MQMQVGHFYEMSIASCATPPTHSHELPNHAVHTVVSCRHIIVELPQQLPMQQVVVLPALCQEPGVPPSQLLQGSLQEGEHG